VHATTLFQAASISKAVAAVGVLVLVEWATWTSTSRERPVALVAPARQRAHAEQPVTLRHLLSHTAGTTVPGFPGYAVGTALPSVTEVLSGGGNTPPVESFARPATRTQYSGGGTTIVQLLVTEVTGRPFPELMAELVLRPFGMTDSAYDQPFAAELGRRAAIGHDAAGRPVPVGHHVYPELQAAGLWTTSIDLARWLIGVQEILRGDASGPISRETALAMITPHGDGSFGLGPELGGEGDLRRFGHSGGNEGFRSQMDGSRRSTPPVAAILTNAAGGTTLCAELRRAFAEEYGWGRWMARDRAGGRRRGRAPPYWSVGTPDRSAARCDCASPTGSCTAPLLRSPADAAARSTTFLDEETGACCASSATASGSADRRARRRNRADGLRTDRTRRMTTTLRPCRPRTSRTAGPRPSRRSWTTSPSRPGRRCSTPSGRRTGTSPRPRRCWPTGPGRRCRPAPRSR
jgi:CubicO group peptidase (beta-lactamase class C family)